jgi:hypothetical protein
MSNVKGAFVFRNEGNGCLTSVYIEHRATTSYSEACKKTEVFNSTDPFEGDYQTTWLEPEHRTASLRIRRSEDVYNLHWTSISDSDWQYDGTAMWFEGKLVGCYWKR